MNTVRHIFFTFIFLVFGYNSYAQSAWHQDPNYPGNGRVKAATFVIGHFGYVCCGQRSSSPAAQSSDCWRWDQHTNKWTSIASYPGGGSYAPGGFSYQNYGFVVCGWDGSKETNDMWRYDTITNAWTKMAPFPGVPRDNVFAFVLGTKAIVGCGSINTPPYLQDIYEYDIIANTWTPKNNFPIQEAGEIYFKIGNSGYVGTGTGGSSFWKYIQSTDSWQAMAPVPTSLDHAVAFAMDGKGYVGTGFASGVTANFWMYDTLTNTWCQIQSLPAAPRCYTIKGFSIGHIGYIMCGLDAGFNPLDDFWEYYPAPGFTVADTIICPGAPVKFTDTTDFGPTNWSWTFIGGTPSSSTQQNPTTTYSSSGTYTVRLIVGNSCMTDTVIKTIHVTVSGPPISISGNNPICKTGSDTITASGGTSYTWSTGATTSSIIVSPSATTTYSVQVTNGSCTKDTTITVISVPSLTALIKGSDTLCSGNTLLLNASGGATYLWNTGATTSSIVVAPAANTSYSVQVKSGSCVADTSVFITVLPSPSANLTYSSSSLCKGDSAILTISGGSTYKWSNGATSSVITVMPAATTTYSVQVSNGGFCVKDTSVTITVNTKPVASTGSSQAICLGNETYLSASGGMSYQWVPSTGLSCATCDSTLANAAVTTTYTVIVSNGNCSDTAFEKVNVNAPPNGFACCATNIGYGDTIRLYDTGVGITGYVWLPNEGLNCDTCKYVIATPTVTTIYTVAITGKNGCVSFDTVTIGVEGCSNFWIPNAFTPNGDEVNDVFAPKGKCIVSYSMYIFDRWGQLIYTTESSKPWPGPVIHKGTVVQQDTYVYKMIITDSNFQQHSFLGRVTVLE